MISATMTPEALRARDRIFAYLHRMEEADQWLQSYAADEDYHRRTGLVNCPNSEYGSLIADAEAMAEAMGPEMLALAKKVAPWWTAARQPSEPPHWAWSSYPDTEAGEKEAWTDWLADCQSRKVNCDQASVTMLHILLDRLTPTLVATIPPPDLPIEDTSVPWNEDIPF